MGKFTEEAARLREDAAHSGYKLGPKSTARLLETIEDMARTLDVVRDEHLLRGTSPS